MMSGHIQVQRDPGDSVVPESIHSAILWIANRRSAFSSTGDDVMVRAARALLVVATVALLLPSLALEAAVGDDLVDNPLYKYWANFKKNSTVTRHEKTVFDGPEKNTVPDGIDEKEVTYKLVSTSPEKVVVSVVVLERGFLNATESAATKHIYFAKIKKSHLQAGLHGVEPKMGKDTLEVLGKKLDCVTASGVEKKEGTEVDHKIWLSDQVPGGIVKHTRTTKVGGKTYADTTITVKSYDVK
jgi:hypothetical protein